MSGVSISHYLSRAEKLRIAMLTAHDPAAQSRLRNLVHKYRELALRAERRIGSPPFQATETADILNTGKHSLSKVDGSS